jgi:Na+/H+-dicarboxylate symporter
MPSRFLNLEKLMVLALVLGLLFGYFFPDLTDHISFLGSIFVKLLKLIALPLVAFSILSAMTNLKDTNEFRKMGAITFGLYLLTSVLAFFVTFVICIFVNIKVDGIGPEASIQPSSSSFVDMFIPGNIFEMFSDGNIVQIILFCLVIGLLSLSLPKKSKELFCDFVELGQQFCFKSIHKLLLVAPIGIFSLIAHTVSKLDYKTLPQIAQLCILLGVCLAIHSLISLPLIAKLIGRFNSFAMLKDVKRVLLMAISTASSNATLPVSLATLKEKSGVSSKVADFVLPLGATFNMDGSAVFQTLVYLSIASVSGVSLGFGHYIMLVVIVVFSSVGVAGIPGGALAVTAFMFSFLGLPEEYLGIVILLDRFWDYPITMVNVWGDLIVTKVIDNRLKI